MSFLLYAFIGIGLAQEIPAPPQEQEFEVSGFVEGLHTRYSPNAIPDKALSQALNVLVDEDVDGVVVRRNGFAKCNTSAIGSGQTIRGLWTFDDDDGTFYHVALSSETFYKHTGDCSWTAITGLTNYSQTLDFDCTQALGKLWCANGSTVFYWDGTSTKTVSGAPAGSLIDNFRNRIVISKVSGNLSRFYLSGELDGEDWTIPGVASSTSPAIIAVGGVNDGNQVNCLMGTYGDTYFIGKRKSIFGLYGFSRDDFALREFSREVGCLEDKTVQEKNNALYWLSLRGVEKMYGNNIERVSDPVRDLIDTIIATTGNSKSFTDTTQSDFQAGNLTASGQFSPVSATLSPNNVVPSTWGVIETSSADFNNGSYTNVTTSPISGALTMYQSGYGAFTNAGSESNSTTLNWDQNQFTSQAGSMFGSRDWIFENLNETCGNNAVITMLDADNNPLTANTITLNDNMSTTDTTISLSSFTNLMVKFQLEYNGSVTGTLRARSVPFIRPERLTVRYTDGRSAGTFCQLEWDVDEALEHSSATYRSKIFDTGFSTPTYGPFSALFSSNAASALSFQVQSSTAGDGGGFETVVAQNNDAKIGAAQRKFVRYLANWTVDKATQTPVLFLEAELNAGTTAYFISQCREIRGISSYGLFSCNVTQNNGSVTFELSTGAVCANAIQSTGTWVATTNNTVPTVPTAPFIAYRAKFDVDSSSEVPTLHDCTINYSSGTSRPASASAVYRDRYHLAFTSATSAGAKNDHQLVLNKNDRWTLFDNQNCYSLGIYERKLYCGSSASNGFVYRLDTGTNDDGSAFRSIFRTKAYSFGRPDVPKNYMTMGAELEQEPDESYAISATFNYYIDRGTTPFTFGSVDMGEDAGHLLWADMPFPLSQPTSSRYIQLEGDLTGDNHPFRFYKGVLKYYGQRAD